MKTKELEKYPLQILMMTLTSFLTLLIPKLLSYLIDDILMANNKEKILPWFMITFGVTSLLMIMKFYFITYNPIKIGIKNTFRLQIKAAKDILNMNQSVYADEDKGYYYNVCSNSCAAYGDLYEEIHLNLISCFIYVCGILAVVFMTNIYLGIFFIVYGIVLIIVSLNISKPLFDMQKNVMVKQDRYLNGIRNIIENKIGINALHREKFFADEYKQNIVPYEKHVLRYRFLECLCRQAPNILDQVCLVVFLFIGGNLVLNQKISIGEFLMMYQYMAYFSDPITTACAILMRYRANMVHVARIDKLSDDAKIPKETKKYMTNTENLFFTEKYDFYKGKEKTDFLFHIDKLKIKKGGLYVIKGENGSGKSTLLEAIAVAHGFNPEGGTKNYVFSTYDEYPELCDAIRLSKGYRKEKWGYFLRAESFYNVATQEEQYADIAHPSAEYHKQSHGESFLALVHDNFGANGLYLLDEPEAALSPQR